MGGVSDPSSALILFVKANPSRRASKSLGPPRPTIRRPSARSRSGAPFRISRRSLRRASFSTKKLTASSRSPIPPGSVRGADRRCANRRAPGPVTVRSTAANRVPVRSPVKLRVISRLRLVAGSISNKAPTARRIGGSSRGSLPTCVRSRYSTKDPNAANSARSKSP